MARKIAPSMKPWLKFGFSCAKACVFAKARAAGMKISGKK